MRNWITQPKQPVNIKIPHALWQRAKAANINFSKATIDGLMARLGQATPSEMIDACRSIIRSIQETGAEHGDLKDEYFQSLAGVLKILALLDSDVAVSKPQMDQLMISSFPLNSGVLRAHTLGPEVKTLFEKTVNSDKDDEPELQKSES